LTDRTPGGRLVVDASALVEVVTGTATGRAVARRLGSATAVAPDIIDSEVASSLRRQHRWGTLDDRRLHVALDLLLDWPGPRVPTRLVVRASRRWWGNVSAYDSLYLAVARAAEASVLTCDGRLARAPGTGVPVENVRVT
jgi:predicted nucleic acid-binding protein